MTRRGELHYLGPQRSGEPRHWVTSQYHPAYGMRKPEIREESERNWDTLHEMLRDVGGILCEWCGGEAAREGIECACQPSNGKVQKEQAPW